MFSIHLAQIRLMMTEKMSKGYQNILVKIEFCQPRQVVNETTDLAHWSIKPGNDLKKGGHLDHSNHLAKMG